MQSFYFLFTLFFALAGRVLAFDIPFGNGVISTSTILAIPDNPVTQACAAKLTAARTRIADCNNNNACLCRPDTVVAVLDSETCMLHYLIAKNIPAPDTRAGSNVIMGGYGAGCAALNLTVPANLTALTLPDNWDGPFTAVLPVGAAIVVVVFATLLSGSGLWLISTM